MEMNYSIEFNNNEYPMITYSMKLAEQIEKTTQTNLSNVPYKTKCRAMYEFCELILGKEAVKEIMGDFLNSDPNHINIVYSKIVRAYEKPFDDYNNAQIDSKITDTQLDKLADIIGNLSKVKLPK